jgi:hypothetical protein
MTGQRGSRVVGARSGVLIAAGTAVGVLVLAGCGGGSSKAAATGSPTPAVSQSVSAAPSSAVGSDRPRNTAAIAAYTACLQQHGVTLPSFSRGARPSGSFSPPPGGFTRPPGASGGPGDGGFGGGFGGSADPSTAAARAACASLLPAGGFGGGRGGGAISATTFAAFKSCMADKGVTITVTDPQQALRALDRTVAKTAAALKVCQPILGTRAGASGAPAAAPTASAATSS